MAYGAMDAVKERLTSAIPSGVTDFDVELDEAQRYANDIINEMLKLHNVSSLVSPPSIIVHAENDLSAVLWIEQNSEKYGEELVVKAERLRTRAFKNVELYLNATKKKRYYVGVNDVDSGVD